MCSALVAHHAKLHFQRNTSTHTSHEANLIDEKALCEERGKDGGVGVEAEGNGGLRESEQKANTCLHTQTHTRANLVETFLQQFSNNGVPSRTPKLWGSHACMCVFVCVSVSLCE